MLLCSCSPFARYGSLIEFELPVPSLQNVNVSFSADQLNELGMHYLERPAETEPTGEVGDRGLVLGEVE